MFSTEALGVPLLLLAAAYDVTARRIPNTITVPLALMGAATSYWAGGLKGVGSSVGAAVLVGAVLFLVWRMRALGGGDLKLAVAASMWIGLERLGSFAIAAGIAGGAIAVLCFAASSRAVQREIATNLRLAAARVMPPLSIAQSSGRVSVPYGAAVAVAALWVLARS